MKELQSITDEERFFLEPSHTRQRQYEAPRACLVGKLPPREAARRFGYQPGSFRVLCYRFRHHMDRDFFRDIPHGPKTHPKKDAVRSRVIVLRKQNYSVYDIRDELQRLGKQYLSSTAIAEILREEGFSRLPRRADDERPEKPRPSADAVADVRQFALEERIFTTHAAGLFLQIGRATV